MAPNNKITINLPNYVNVLQEEISKIPAGKSFSVKDIFGTLWNSFSDTERQEMGRQFAAALPPFTGWFPDVCRSLKNSSDDVSSTDSGYMDYAYYIRNVEGNISGSTIYEENPNKYHVEDKWGLD